MFTSSTKYYNAENAFYMGSRKNSSSFSGLTIKRDGGRARVRAWPLRKKNSFEAQKNTPKNVTTKLERGGGCN